MTARAALPAALAATLLAAAPLAAHAAVPNISVWTGKTKAHKTVITLSQAGPGKALFAVLQVSCTNASGTEQAWTMQAHGVPSRSGKVSLMSKKAINAEAGTLKVSATALAHHRATGTVTWSLPAGYGSCAEHDTFNLKWSLSHGG